MACIAYRVGGVFGFDIARFGRGEVTDWADGILAAAQRCPLGKRGMIYCRPWLSGDVGALGWVMFGDDGRDATRLMKKVMGGGDIERRIASGTLALVFPLLSVSTVWCKLVRLLVMVLKKSAVMVHEDRQVTGFFQCPSPRFPSGLLCARLLSSREANQKFESQPDEARQEGSQAGKAAAAQPHLPSPSTIVAGAWCWAQVKLLCTCTTTHHPQHPPKPKG